MAKPQIPEIRLWRPKENQSEHISHYNILLVKTVKIRSLSCTADTPGEMLINFLLHLFLVQG